MLKVGLTGTIGSGKSTVGRIFALLGAPVYSADDASKRLLLENPAIRSRVHDLFGDEVFLSGKPDAALLASRVFGDPGALDRLNALMHPAVAVDFNQWVNRHGRASYVIMEAALLFEAGADNGLDFVIAVTAPETLREKRTAPRYAASPGQFRLRQQRQWPESEKAARADFIIRNDESEPVIPQVLALHKKFST